MELMSEEVAIPAQPTFSIARLENGQFVCVTPNHDNTSWNFEREATTEEVQMFWMSQQDGGQPQQPQQQQPQQLQPQQQQQSFVTSMQPDDATTMTTPVHAVGNTEVSANNLPAPLEVLHNYPGRSFPS